MISITTNKEIIIRQLINISEELEDDVERAVKETAEAVQKIAQSTITNAFELSPSSFEVYYNDDIKTNGATAEVTIYADRAIPLVGNFPVKNKGAGTTFQTIKGDDVRFKFRKGEEEQFTSKSFIGRGTAYRRVRNSSSPFYYWFSPYIPDMLIEEEEAFEEAIREALVEKLESLIDL